MCWRQTAKRSELHLAVVPTAITASGNGAHLSGTFNLFCAHFTSFFFHLHDIVFHLQAIVFHLHDICRFQYQVADHFGISESMLSKWLRKRADFLLLMKDRQTMRKLHSGRPPKYPRVEDELYRAFVYRRKVCTHISPSLSLCVHKYLVFMQMYMHVHKYLVFSARSALMPH